MTAVISNDVCPFCGSKVVSRARHQVANSTCEAGHEWHYGYVLDPRQRELHIGHAPMSVGMGPCRDCTLVLSGAGKSESIAVEFAAALREVDQLLRGTQSGIDAHRGFSDDYHGAYTDVRKGRADHYIRAQAPFNSATTALMALTRQLLPDADPLPRSFLEAYQQRLQHAERLLAELERIRPVHWT